MVPQPPVGELVLPARLGDYQLMSKLAVGGMAEVYLARHGELAGFRTLVVVKKVLPHLASHPEFITMFLDEARIASQLDHPNVVRIVEVGRAGDEFFLAMELVQGKPLSSLIRRGMDRKEQLAPKMAAWIVAQAAAGLHHAHQLADAEGNLLHLVHRDVSPQNILVSFEGAVKVIDFGIARALGRLSDTGTGQLKGKFGYMSPEHATGGEIGLWTDVFALGVVLWESLCGRRLFARSSDRATLKAILDEPVPPPSTVVKVPPGLEAIVMKALAREPRQRFESAQKMREALERFTVVAGGVTSGDVGTLMKSYFAEERARWLVTTRQALEAEARVDSPSTRDMKLSQTSIPLFPIAPVSHTEMVDRPAPSRRRLGLAAALVAAAVFTAATVVVAVKSSPAPPPVDRKPILVPPAPPPKVPAPPARAPAPPAELSTPAEELPMVHSDPMKPTAKPRPVHPAHRPAPRIDLPSNRRPNPF
jgi:serine/threonine protein kinase